MAKEIELVVHVGMGKTGSTSIQKTLNFHASLLQERKAYYLGLMFENSPIKKYSWQRPGGWADVQNMSSEKAIKEISEIAVETLSVLGNGGYEKLIWSNESLFSNHRVVLPILEKLAATGVGIKIVLYIRRHESWARSAYFQWGIKHKTYTGPVKSFHQWIQDKSMNYSGIVNQWLRFKSAELLIRNFDGCKDVVVDFLNCTGMGDYGLESLRDNETPNATVMALYAIYNSQFENEMLPEDLLRLMRNTSLINVEPIGCDFNELVPNPEDLEYLREQSAAEREYLNKVLIEHNQPPILDESLSTKNYSVGQDKINAAILLLLDAQAKQIRHLQKRIKRIESEEK